MRGLNSEISRRFQPAAMKQPAAMTRPAAMNITRREVIDRILSHVKVPRYALTADEPTLAYYDVTGEPVPAWAFGVDPDPDERGPPMDCGLVDPPAPDE